MRNSSIALLFVGCSAPATVCPAAIAPPSSSPAEPALAPIGVKGSPDLTVIGMTLSSAKRFEASLELGTTVAIEAHARGGKLLGIDREHSAIVSFTDDRGASLIDPKSVIYDAMPNDNGERVMISLHTPRLPSRDARRVIVHAKLALQYVGEESVVVETLAPNESRDIKIQTAVVHLHRTEGTRSPSLFDSDSRATPASVIEIEGLDGLDRNVGNARFQIDGAAARGDVTTEMTMENGVAKNGRKYHLAFTKSPIRVEIPITAPRTQIVDIEAVAGFGLE